MSYTRTDRKSRDILIGQESLKIKKCQKEELKERFIAYFSRLNTGLKLVGMDIEIRVKNTYKYVDLLYYHKADKRYILVKLMAGYDKDFIDVACKITSKVNKTRTLKASKPAIGICVMIQPYPRNSEACYILNIAGKRDYYNYVASELIGPSVRYLPSVADIESNISWGSKEEEMAVLERIFQRQESFGSSRSD